jgi:hypothetical protein
LGDFLQFTLGICGTGQTGHRVVGDQEFHRILSDLLNLSILGADDHAFLDRQFAGNSNFPIVHFDHTDTA